MVACAMSSVKVVKHSSNFLPSIFLPKMMPEVAAILFSLIGDLL